MPAEFETYDTIYSDWYRIYKRSQVGNRRPGDKEVPMRLRGYSELAMANIKDDERNKIVKAIRQGYSLWVNNRARAILVALSRCVPFTIGYIGKTRASLWFPTDELCNRCYHMMEAQLVITDMFKANDMKRVGKSIRIDVSTNNRTISHLTELRMVVDEFMAEWADTREPFAQQVADISSVFRVPFDSHLEK